MIYVDGNLARTTINHKTNTKAPQPKGKGMETAQNIGYAAGLAYTTKALWMPAVGGIAGGLFGGLPGAEAGFAAGLRYGMA